MLWFDINLVLWNAWLNAYDEFWRGHPGRRVELRLVSFDGHAPERPITVVRWV